MFAAARALCRTQSVVIPAQKASASLFCAGGSQSLLFPAGGLAFKQLARGFALVGAAARREEFRLQREKRLPKVTYVDAELKR